MLGCVLHHTMARGSSQRPVLSCTAQALPRQTLTHAVIPSHPGHRRLFFKAAFSSYSFFFLNSFLFTRVGDAAISRTQRATGGAEGCQGSRWSKEAQAALRGCVQAPWIQVGLGLSPVLQPALRYRSVPQFALWGRVLPPLLVSWIPCHWSLGGDARSLFSQCQAVVDARDAAASPRASRMPVPFSASWRQVTGLGQ